MTPSDSLLLALALASRTLSLVAFGLLYWALARSSGGLIRPLKMHVGSMIIFLLWMWVAAISAVTTVFGFDATEHGILSVAEFALRWVFIPNLGVTIAIVNLFIKVHTPPTEVRRG